MEVNGQREWVQFPSGQSGHGGGGGGGASPPEFILAPQKYLAYVEIMPVHKPSGL